MLRCTSTWDYLRLFVSTAPANLIAAIVPRLWLPLTSTGQRLSPVGLISQGDTPIVVVAFFWFLLLFVVDAVWQHLLRLVADNLPFFLVPLLPFIMPYATPTTSPVSTSVTILPSPPRSGPSTPRMNGTPTPNVVQASQATKVVRSRNHVRSYSHDAVASSIPRPARHNGDAGFISVFSSETKDQLGPSAQDGVACPVKSNRTNSFHASGTATAPALMRSHRWAGLPPFTPNLNPKVGDNSSSTPSSSSGESGSSGMRPLHQKARSEVGMRIEFNEGFKTPMIRKKSGELVRPSLKSVGPNSSRRSKAMSAPATPLGPKNVHFDSHLEHVKHFLSQQRPTAVSRDGSPFETETEGEEEFPFPFMTAADTMAGVTLHMPNFPVSPDFEGKTKDVYLRSLDIAADKKSLRGVVQVKNLAFQKWIAVRFTFDSWQTVSEVSAEWCESVPGGESDRFSFHIKLQDILARIEEKTMFLAVRFTTDGHEIWDNNGGVNYHIEFRRSKKGSGTGAGPVAPPAKMSQLNWSMATDESITRVRAQLTQLLIDDFAVPSTAFKKNRDPASMGSAGGAFSSRYDFGTSLKQVSGGSPRGSPMNSPPRPRGLAFPSTYINGFPATSAPINEPLPLDGATELPTFVAPYIPPTRRPPSPIQDADEDMMNAFPHAAKAAVQTHKPGTRFFSFPPTRPGISSLYTSGNFGVDRLNPPDGRSSSMFTNGTPTISPSVSPLSYSPPRCETHSASGIKKLVEMGPPSLSPSNSGASSPESPAVGSSPLLAPCIDRRADEPMPNTKPDMESGSYDDFLQSFCWGGGALGLTTAPYEEPLPSFVSDRRNSHICSAAMTPRSSSPMPLEIF